jgi:alkaline phosphatase
MCHRMSILFALALCLVGIVPQARAENMLKNVILMIGDGMGINQITAANCYQGVSRQPYQQFPVRVFQTTFAYGGSYDPAQAWADFGYVMDGYTDSAPAASAMSTGCKVAEGQINVDPVSGAPLFMSQTRAEELGKATGVVTSMPWSHATPAAFGAHNISRNNYVQIAQEMIDHSGLEVIMGCGHPLYNDNNQPTSASYSYVGGQRQWDSLTAGLTAYTLIQTRAEFQALASGPTPDRVCGTARCRTTLQQARTLRAGEGGNGDALPYTAPLNADVPTLVEMTRAALNVLDDDPDGFFVMIEGGAIDMACHGNQKGRLIEEQTDFNNAVSEVIAWIEAHSNWDETLLIVTADHETGYLLGNGSGYPAVFNPLTNNGAGRLPGMWFYSGSHTNSLVPLFAKGIGAVWFNTFAVGSDPVRGAYTDNTDVARVIMGYYDDVLPVELASFTAAAGDRQVTLAWRTASETHTDRFEILRDQRRVARIEAENQPAGSSYEWTDAPLSNGVTYSYTLVSVGTDGSRAALQTIEAMPRSNVAVGRQFALHPCYPNPFNARTTFSFTLPASAPISLRIFDPLGREVAVLNNGLVGAGTHRIVFNGSVLTSGTYFARLDVGAFSQTQKVLLLK